MAELECERLRTEISCRLQYLGMVEDVGATYGESAALAMDGDCNVDGGGSSVERPAHWNSMQQDVQASFVNEMNAVTNATLLDRMSLPEDKRSATEEMALLRGRTEQSMAEVDRAVR